MLIEILVFAYYTLFNISYIIEKFIYILYTTIIVYKKEAKKSCGI
jgi:hypothetical protein